MLLTETITIQANGKTTQAVIAGLAGDPIIDSCLPLPGALGFEWTQATFPGVRLKYLGRDLRMLIVICFDCFWVQHKPVQWKVEL